MDEMDMHPNWVGLATTYFERKIFIRAGEEVSNNSEKLKKYELFSNSSINGEDVKNMYMEIISEPGKAKSKSESQEQQVKNNSKSEKKIECRTSQDLPIIPNDRLTQQFLLAAQENNVTTLSEIFSKCPGVLNTTDKFGWTALMCSTQSQAIDAVNFLINNNADISVRENTGKTALNLTQNNSHIYNALTEKFKSVKLIKNQERKRRKSNKKIFCEICKEYYQEQNKNEHLTSTLHTFSLSKKTKTRTFYGIPESNRGYQILLRNGWDRENGLGPNGTGHKFPLKTVHKVDKNGLGNKTEVPRVTHTFESIKEKDRCRTETYRMLRKKYRKKHMTHEQLLERSIRISLS